MGRYVVVEFESNDEAEQFIQSMNSDKTLAKYNWRVRIAGIFVKPGRTCQCYGWEFTNYGDKNKQFGITRGLKFGWWVCDQCGKPRKAGHQLVNQVTMSELPEGVTYDSYEFCVTGIDVTGIHTSQIGKRKKRLRRPKEK